MCVCVYAAHTRSDDVCVCVCAVRVYGISGYCYIIIVITKIIVKQECNNFIDALKKTTTKNHSVSLLKSVCQEDRKEKESKLLYIFIYILYNIVL